MNKDFNFSWKFKNFHIRTRHEDWNDRNSPLKKNYPVELVKYFDDKHSSCYTVAWFELDDEGYSLRFIGNRPLVDISADEIAAIWVELQAAQKMLDAYFEACQESEWNDYCN